jgi:hypothetical protein
VDHRDAEETAFDLQMMALNAKRGDMRAAAESAMSAMRAISAMRAAGDHAPATTVVLQSYVHRELTTAWDAFKSAKPGLRVRLEASEKS